MYSTGGHGAVGQVDKRGGVRGVRVGGGAVPARGVARLGCVWLPGQTARSAALPGPSPPTLLVEGHAVEVDAGGGHPELPACRGWGPGRGWHSSTGKSRSQGEQIRRECSQAKPRSVGRRAGGTHTCGTGRGGAHAAACGVCVLAPSSMLGTRSRWILSGICEACPVSARFQANTTASTAGASASWFSATCARAQGKGGVDVSRAGRGCNPWAPLSAGRATKDNTLTPRRTPRPRAPHLGDEVARGARRHGPVHQVVPVVLPHGGVEGHQRCRKGSAGTGHCLDTMRCPATPHATGCPPAHASLHAAATEAQLRPAAPLLTPWVRGAPGRVRTTAGQTRPCAACARGRTRGPPRRAPGARQGVRGNGRKHVCVGDRGNRHEIQSAEAWKLKSAASARPLARAGAAGEAGAAGARPPAGTRAHLCLLAAHDLRQQVARAGKRPRDCSAVQRALDTLHSGRRRGGGLGGVGAWRLPGPGVSRPASARTLLHRSHADAASPARRAQAKACTGPGAHAHAPRRVARTSARRRRRRRLQRRPAPAAQAGHRDGAAASQSHPLQDAG